MNSRQLEKLGVPHDCVREAIAAIQTVSAADATRGKRIKQQIKSVLDRPESFVADEYFGAFAKALIEDREFVRTALLPTAKALAAGMQTSTAEIRAALERLAAGKAIVLQPESRAPLRRS